MDNTDPMSMAPGVLPEHTARFHRSLAQAGIPKGRASKIHNRSQQAGSNMGGSTGVPVKQMSTKPMKK